MGIISDEALVEFETFLLQYAHRHFDASLADFLNAAPLHLGKRIYTTADTSFHSFLYYKVGTRRRLAVMRTGFETHVNSGFMQQRLILRSDRGKGIHLSMSLAAAHMIALAQDSAILTYDNGSHHGIGLRILTAILRQLQTAVEQSVLDREGYAKEAIQMDKKVKSDELAYRVTLRKYEEGLMSTLDVQTSANTLLESKANLLQKRLMYLLKSKLVDYYKGKPLINE